MPLTIRAATEADIPTILALIQALADYERLRDACVATDEQLRQTLFGPTPFAEVIIGEEAGRAVGFALYFHNYSTFLAKPGIYLEDLFVWPEDRGKGYGKALLLAVVATAKERGCGRVEWSVLDWNEPSIQFYRSLGAVPMDEWTTMRLDEVAMCSLAGQGR